MTDDTTIEEQVERAMKQWTFYNGHPELRQLLRDVLAGKFKEAPLPEIVPPPWPHNELFVAQGGCGFYVYSKGIDGWGAPHGPSRPTKRECIEAWNAVFTRKDER